MVNLVKKNNLCSFEFTSYLESIKLKHNSLVNFLDNYRINDLSSDIDIISNI